MLFVFNKHQLTYYNLIQPIVDEIGYRINMKPSKIIDCFELSDRYFDKIRAHGILNVFLTMVRT